MFASERSVMCLAFTKKMEDCKVHRFIWFIDIEEQSWLDGMPLSLWPMI